MKKAKARTEKVKKERKVLTTFSGKAKPTLTGNVERKCGVCGRKSISAWSFIKVRKGRKRKGTEKLTEKDFVCRDIKLCKKKK